MQDLIHTVTDYLKSRGCDITNVEAKDETIIATCADGCAVEMHIHGELTQLQLQHAADTLLYAGLA
jgi:hypothetical protein